MIEPLVRLTAIAAPMMRANIDTDIIIPSREIRGVSKTGLAGGLFANWRYIDAAARTPAPDFVLNNPRYRGTQILLGGDNFGCGSSREQAVWALREYGVRAILATRFNAIFYNNCVRNGIAPLLIAEHELSALAARLDEATQPLLTIDLDTLSATTPDGARFNVTLPDEPRQMLMQGLDIIALTQLHRAQIDAHEQADRLSRPWAYLVAPSNRPRP